MKLSLKVLSHTPFLKAQLPWPKCQTFFLAVRQPLSYNTITIEIIIMANISPIAALSAKSATDLTYGELNNLLSKASSLFTLKNDSFSDAF